ncbi:Gfo/Idh/MocA family oxidoreductase [Campylobacter sp. RM12640]|uniref:Gfo/Idh/MocA family protein n=1 Tax=unclassified Campylobacter TaxID=2593542 RepID=UPI001BD96058|nr:MULTISPECIES: Gfo/Idh/MocA family oxidoreductase [unclassified Campylobacter]MBZ7977573.1 Gfo/Idh/MocA family oxidoreductase [Campylobacter sp. RM12654]MBZ7981284.1 Gfo/Idh/MocA family oxidoreductase [Campylobacter sp. RM12640]MBZ7989498.1 Gfo/Idh/MocA family oxidoreductase [Campylobacter sp. RM12635]MBT0883418.1 Gfo/Idh/MocA family oxidoreductase [Campylobacter sp. 2018MI13]ULO03167.1 oxidoreductase, Gfo/Idh/MocA family [Campylobacter sp. RM12651]
MNIALIGLGVMGKNHYTELCKKDINLYCFDLIKPDWIDDNKYFSNLDELLKNDIDGAIIVVPTKYHYEVFSKIKDKINFILIEKPLSFSLDEALAIKNSGVNVAVGFCERFNPVSLEFLKHIKNEEIKYASFIRASKKPARISDVGVDLDLCVHDLDLANFFGIKASFKINRTNNPCTQIKLNSNNLDILASWEFNSRIRKAFINTNVSSYELDFLNSKLIKDETTITLQAHSSLAKEQDEFINYIKTNDLGLLASVDDAIYTQEILKNLN